MKSFRNGILALATAEITDKTRPRLQALLSALDVFEEDFRLFAMVEEAKTLEPSTLKTVVDRLQRHGKNLNELAKELRYYELPEDPLTFVYESIAVAARKKGSAIQNCNTPPTQIPRDRPPKKISHIFERPEARSRRSGAARMVAMNKNATLKPSQNCVCGLTSGGLSSHSEQCILP